MSTQSFWRRPLRWLAITATAAAFSQGVAAQTAICYNCPPEWADWAAQIRAIKE